MDTKWFKLLPDTRSTILDALNESMLGLTPQGVANSIYGFGLMGTMRNYECNVIIQCWLCIYQHIYILPSINILLIYQHPLSTSSLHTSLPYQHDDV